MKKSSTKKHQPEDFESTLEALEQIVAELEDEQLPLETLIDHYEKGTQHLADCEAILNQAKKRLQSIQESADSRSNSSQKTADKSDKTATLDTPTGSNDTTNAASDDDIRLL